MQHTEREKERETQRRSALQKRTNVSTYRFRSSEEVTSPLVASNDIVVRVRARVFMYLLKVRVAFLCRTVVFEPPFYSHYWGASMQRLRKLNMAYERVFTKKYSSN